jgi:ABC-type branched-subunit amino acid transport system ATPase component
VVLIDEPFAGLTTTEIKVFSDLIRTLRDEGRAVLLVDHSVKSVAALADRVIAMYLGERIAEGSADEVMQNETVRRVYIGGAIEAVERKGAAAEAVATLLDVDAVEVFYGKANALDRVALRVQQDEFVSIVGLNGAGKTTLFNAISGLVPYRGAIRFAGRDLKSLTAGARSRHSRPAFQGDRTVAARALAHAAARRAERDVRPAPFRPRLRARPRPHYLARRSGALRAGNEHRVFVIPRHASKRRMAEAHPASFRSRMAASICGVKRRSDCQRLAKRSGSGKKPARKPAR